jgi:hypothetical protein
VSNAPENNATAPATYKPKQKEKKIEIGRAEENSLVAIAIRWRARKFKHNRSPALTPFNLNQAKETHVDAALRHNGNKLRASKTTQKIIYIHIKNHVIFL